MDTDHDHSDPQSKQSRWGFRGMTVRNWLELLIVPMVLVGIGLLFEMQQADRQLATEKHQQNLEKKRANAERELAVQGAQDEALRSFFDEMSTLLLREDLRNSDQDSEARTLARARTLTVLRTVDASRKSRVVLFLDEAKLIGSVDGRDPIVDLNYADLKGANLSFVNLSGANLSPVDMSGATLGYTDLSDANLSSGSNLSGADFEFADLSGADLSYANLTDANVTLGQLDEVDSLKGATMPNGQKYEDWLKDR